ncbi:hypothetical protein [Gayadomonas joobiniege]|uniref:hypothetical protein n=1 Tax=Gayadomonas joobiniege TaxID=1234606 RepID=UPI0003651EFA|nr:hypothetical protein [Gayadomonas joobiniege]
MTKKLLITLLTILTSIQLSGCNNASAFVQNGPTTETKTAPISEQVRQVAYQSFHNRFVHGTWRFNGIKIIKNEINVYIQIPEQLDMSKSQQEAYIKSRLCPDQNDPLHKLAEPPQVWVHIYTFNKIHGSYAKCDMG